MEDRLLLSTYVVTNVNNSGSGSLRQAILDSNGNPGSNTINFNVSGSGVHTISPSSALPTITVPVIVDGTSEQGYSGSPLIVLSGTDAGPGANGLTITAGSSTVKGLAINSFKGNGIVLQTKGNNIITGDYVGTDATGAIKAANGSSGVNILSGSNNIIGGTTTALRNLLSGNVGYGLAISGSATQVLGNYIGTTISGAAALGNTSGIYVFGSNNAIGGTATGAGNVISGNTIDGIYIPSGSGNLLQGNIIGANSSGLTALANGRYGVNAASPATGDTIGGTTAAARNLISGNKSAGIFLQGSSNQVLGNYIGTTITVGDVLPNSEGILIKGGKNSIGGMAMGAGNLIAGNTTAGIDVTGNDNLVVGNLIGTNSVGQKALPNSVGVTIGGSNNTVGGTGTGSANLISGNLNAGVNIGGGSNNIEGNFIGTDLTGSSALPNGVGVVISAGSNNTMGGADTGAANVISGNTADGIDILADGNTVLANLIGTDVSAANPLGNGQNGIYITASNNYVGGNVIFFNGGDGVAVDGGVGDAIQQNSIGLNGGLGIDLINNGNNNAAAPVLSDVILGDGTTTIDGTLTSTPSTTFTIDLFANNDCNPSGYGDGEIYLGSVTVTTDATGFATFTFTAQVTLDPSQFVSATATDPFNNTSGFAQCLPVS
jgi:titin